jgi:cytochrome c-type biogenesis protein CcmH/NrfG
MRPITASYNPGDRFYENFDLITLENTDFYPDGRDLGENYTMTSWQMNSCQQNSQLHCVTCHTSSGRYRFKSDDFAEANKACTSCHEENGRSYVQHTHHPLTGTSPKCIDCHMPTTRFGNMMRSDHSFRPPMPAATMKFKSPNACNLCHSDQSADWANKLVKQWKKNDYQKETLYIGSLIDEARNGKWGKLDEMLNAIETNKYGEVFTNSLIRILTSCDNPKKWPVLVGALKLESTLSRSSAALGLLGYRNDQAEDALFLAAKDEILLVRLAAAQSLAVFPQERWNASRLELFRKVNAEYETSLISRPDDWSSYYNLGNHYQNLGNSTQALLAYNNSLKIYPDAIMPLINSSYLYSVSGDQTSAEANLRKALKVDPFNEAANLNLGLLMAEMQRMDEAEKALRNVFKVNGKNSTAAYNLSVIVSSRDFAESCKWSKLAMDASPDDPKFAYTYAYFLNENKNSVAAMTQLEKTIRKFPTHLPSIFLLGNVYSQKGKNQDAIRLYNNALKRIDNDFQAKQQLESEIARLKTM